jgi:uncharacterized protein (TIGR01777 family)
MTSAAIDPMTIVLTGGSGFVGQAICKQLLSRGHSVVILTRRRSVYGLGRPGLNSPGMVSPGVTIRPYNPDPDNKIPLELLAAADGIVNLAGEPIFTGRWTAAKKQRILDSRIQMTSQIVAGLSRLKDQKPRVLVSASAIGYYGPRTDELISEQSSPGSDFLAQVCLQWEAEAMKATAAGVRTVILRTGIVLDQGGGALGKMVLPFKFFLGGTIGSGRQWLSWIHRTDLAAIYVMALEDTRFSGPFNAVAPGPVRMAEASKAIGRVLHRPCWLPIPAFLVKLLIGESGQVVVTGQHVQPQVLQKLEFPFQFPEINQALRSILH